MHRLIFSSSHNAEMYSRNSCISCCCVVDAFCHCVEASLTLPKMRERERWNRKGLVGLGEWMRCGRKRWKGKRVERKRINYLRYGANMKGKDIPMSHFHVDTWKYDTRYTVPVCVKVTTNVFIRLVEENWTGKLKMTLFCRYVRMYTCISQIESWEIQEYAKQGEIELAWPQTTTTLLSRHFGRLPITQAAVTMHIRTCSLTHSWNMISFFCQRTKQTYLFLPFLVTPQRSFALHNFLERVVLRLDKKQA